jgi:hypothetical protein
MFMTTNDDDNRAAVMAIPRAQLKLAGSACMASALPLTTP